MLLAFPDCRRCCKIVSKDADHAADDLCDITVHFNIIIPQSFFFVNRKNNENNRLFFTYKEKDKDNQIIPVGMICAENFPELCDIILQKCGIARKDYDVDASKIKNKRALEILTKIRQGRQQASGKSKHDKDMDLPNLVTAVAVKSNSINFTNIWDLTIYQFYEQFKKEQVGIYFDIQKMSVAAYGNTKNTFKGNEWYKNEN